MSLHRRAAPERGRSVRHVAKAAPIAIHSENFPAKRKKLFENSKNPRSRQMK
jgi:hypothetical protein